MDFKLSLRCRVTLKSIKKDLCRYVSPHNLSKNPEIYQVTCIKKAF